MGALAEIGQPIPCGFLHLPYLPEQVVWLIRQRAGKTDMAPATSLDLPSMAVETQLAAVMAVLEQLASQANAMADSL